LGFDPQSVQAVLLSHAHIDHSGALPILGKHGFRGNVHMTGATADLTAVMLEDSARVQENDCAYVNQKEGRWGEACLSPFYDTDDTKVIVRRFVGTDYGLTIRVAGLCAEHLPRSRQGLRGARRKRTIAIIGKRDSSRASQSGGERSIHRDSVRAVTDCGRTGVIPVPTKIR
jgi:hypothetical protein